MCALGVRINPFNKGVVMKKLVMVLGVLALVGCGKEPEKTPAPQVNNSGVTVGPVTVTQGGKPVSGVVSTTTTQTVTTFTMRPDQFQEAFNKAIPDAKIIHIKKFEIENGSVNNVASYQFRKGLDMIVAVDKASGNMKDVSLSISQGNATTKAERELEVTMVLAVMNTIGKVLIPEQSEAFATTANQLVKQASEKMDGQPVSQQVGHLKLSMMAHPQIGAAFSVAPVQ